MHVRFYNGRFLVRILYGMDIEHAVSEMNNVHGGQVWDRYEVRGTTITGGKSNENHTDKTG